MTIQLLPDAFAALKAQLTNANDAHVTGDTEGVISGHGVNAQYSYKNGQLAVVVIRHPFFISVKSIEERLLATIAGIQAQQSAMREAEAKGNQ